MPSPTQRYYSSVAQQTTVTGALTNTATAVPVAATTGFPATPFCAAIDYGTASEELVLVTNISSGNLTVTRGFSGSTAVAHASNAVFQHVHVSQDFTDFSQHVFANNGVHGVTGNVVGTTDAQTLSNKTLVSPVITGNLNLSTIDDSNGNPAINITAAAGAVNQITVADAATGTAPSVAASGTDANIDLNLQSKGTGLVKHNGIASVDVSTAQTLTNKNLADPSNTLPANLVTTAGAQTLTNKTLGAGTLVGGATTDISGAWTSYTPVVTGATTSPTGVTASGAYMQIGKTVFWKATVVATTAGSGAYSISLPVSAKTGTAFPVGRGWQGAATSLLDLALASATTATGYTQTNAVWTASNAPVTTAVVFSGTYEAA